MVCSTNIILNAKTLFFISLISVISIFIFQVTTNCLDNTQLLLSDDSNRVDSSEESFQTLSRICSIVQNMHRTVLLILKDSKDSNTSNGILKNSSWNSVLNDTVELSLHRKSTNNDIASTNSSTNITGYTRVNTLKNKSDTLKSTTRRQSHCSGCFRHDFTYLIVNESICKSQSDVYLIIMILTSPEGSKNRQAIRNTWLDYASKNTAKIRYVFLLGKNENQDVMDKIQQENKEYGDILQEDFVDSYQNLTYKTIMGFRWAKNHCANAKFIMKTDDDMWVNIPQLLKVLQREESSLQTSLGGSCQQTARPIRDKESKWYVSKEVYPWNTYPGYCSGTGYVTSLKVAIKVYDISKDIPFFYLEDVYVALCLKELGLKLKLIPGFHPGKPKIPLCQYKSSTIVTVHYMSPTQLHEVWNASCPSVHYQ